MLILLETYVGCSDFRFETYCTGRKLEAAELREKELLTEDILRRHSRSSYVPEWYEVKEGDQIRVVRWDDDGQIDETFVVPANLPDSPQSLDDRALRTGMRVYDYLVAHCAKAI